MTLAEQRRLEGEFARLQGTTETLFVHLERTLIALALTFDAQAATLQRLNGHADLEHRHDLARDLQVAAERYRRLARDLPRHPDLGEI